MILDDELKKDVRKYVIQLANELEVCKPKIVYIPKEDQHARANITDNTLTLFNEFDSIYDLYFCIAHEMRHAYQVKYREFYEDAFESYKPRNEVSVHDYNKQLLELDANAFAYMVIRDDFGIDIVFHDLDEDVVYAIKQRAEFIENTEYGGL